MKCPREPSLHFSSTYCDTPKNWAIFSWLSMRLPHSIRALNTTLAPSPEAETYTKRIPSSFMSRWADTISHQRRTSSGLWLSTTWSRSITQSPFNRRPSFLRQRPILGSFLGWPGFCLYSRSVSSKLAMKTTRGRDLFRLSAQARASSEDDLPSRALRWSALRCRCQSWYRQWEAQDESSGLVLTFLIRSTFSADSFSLSNWWSRGEVTFSVASKIDF